jgi:hypothetical protein
MAEKKQCVGVFLDISSAFDSIEPKHIERCLLKHCGDTDLVKWYVGYLERRDMQIELHGVKRSVSNGIGFPQGGVASAKFWLIASDEAVHIINKYDIEGNAYADDCSAVLEGKRIDYVIRKLDKMLGEVIEWGRKCNLKFNEKKAAVVHFSNKRKF